METLTKDTLILLALELNYMDVLKFCSTSKKINRHVCENNYFWRNKLYKEYPLLEKGGNRDFRKFYKEIQEQVQKINTFVEEDKHISGFDMPNFLRPEAINFLLNIDLGFIKGTTIPLKYLIWPILSKGIFTQSLFTFLLNKHLAKQHRVTDDMIKYLDNYLTKLNIDRNNFRYNKIGPLTNALFIPRKELTEFQLEELKSVGVFNLLKMVRD